MKKCNCLFILVLVIALFLTACDVIDLFVKNVVGSGELVVEKREVTSFSKIDAGGNLELHISKKYTGIEVNAESNLMKYIHTYVEGDTLFVEIADTDRSHILLQPLEAIKVYVQFEKVTEISLSGGAEMASEALIAEGVEVKVKLSGGSEAIIDEITSEDLIVDLSGGSELTVSGGKVMNQYIEASGGSVYMAEWVESEAAELTLSGGSEATVWVEETLDIDLSGGSMAYYYGSPADLNEKGNSGGSDYISKGER
jgi:hypothetical protein